MSIQATFKQASLFGGAMVAQIPNKFEDVSEIRQIPDNQEVYLDKEGFSSIIFDILERVEKKGDIEALKFHLSDIVDSDAKETRVWSTEKVAFGRMPNIPAFSLLATSPPGENMRGRANEPDFMAILLLLLRLEERRTDIVLVVNVPHLPSEYVEQDVDLGAGKDGRLIEFGKMVRDRLLETFEIRNWDLFVNE